MRKLHDQDTARKASTATIAAQLKSIVSTTDDSPKTNRSEAGVLGFRWGESNEGNKKFSVFVKPRTDGERDAIENVYGIKSIDIDENGRHLNGKEGLERYAKIKSKVIEADNATILHKEQRKKIVYIPF